MWLVSVALKDCVLCQVATGHVWNLENVNLQGLTLACELSLSKTR